MTTINNNTDAKKIAKRPQRPSRDVMLEKVKAVEAKIEQLQAKLVSFTSCPYIVISLLVLCYIMCTVI
jgi:uncharacterized membrane protein (DUF106 family)